MENQTDSTVEPLLNTSEDEQTSIINDKFVEKWGFDLENLYKIALKFYKG